MTEFYIFSHFHLYQDKIHYLSLTITFCLFAEATGGTGEESRRVGQEGGGAKGLAVQCPGQQLAPSARLHALPALLLPRHQRGHPCRVPGNGQEALLPLAV